MGSPYQVTELGKGFWAIKEDFVRFFLIEGSDKAMLIDTGIGSGNLPELIKSLTDKPLIVVNTHTDEDHIGGNGYFDCIHMHPSEYDYYFSKHTKTIPKLIPIWEGDIIDLGGQKFEVVLIPGHTPGSIALLDRENRLIFAGDSLQRELIFMVGRGRNLIAFGETLKKLLKLIPQFDTVYTFHGSVLVEGTEIVRDVAEAYERLMAGKVKGVPTDQPKKAKIYDCGVTRFLTEPDLEL